MTLSSLFVGGIMAITSLFAPQHSFGTTVCITAQGCTGTSSPSGVLYGDNGATTHLNTVTIGTGLSFSGGTLSSTVVAGAAYPFQGAGNSTSTLTQFNGGLTSYASTTIGDGTSVGGLTVFGTATTTNLKVTSAASAGCAQFSALGVISSAGVACGTANFTYPFPNNATTSVLTFSNGIVVGSLSGFIGGNNGALYAFATSTIKTSQLTNDSGFSTFGYLFTPITNWGTTFPAGTTSQMYINNAGFPAFYAVNASSTNASMTTIAVGGSATTTIDATSKFTGWDTNNSYTGIVSPTKRLVLPSGTTTGWTASTTGTAFSPMVVADFSGTVKKAICLTDASFVGVNIQVNGSNITPSYFIASTTGGTITFTAGNTFTSGQKILANFGTTTTSSTQSVSCTLDIVQTS